MKSLNNINDDNELQEGLVVGDVDVQDEVVPEVEEKPKKKARSSSILSLFSVFSALLIGIWCNAS